MEAQSNIQAMSFATIFPGNISKAFVLEKSNYLRHPFAMSFSNISSITSNCQVGLTKLYSLCSNITLKTSSFEFTSTFEFPSYVDYCVFSRTQLIIYRNSIVNHFPRTIFIIPFFNKIFDSIYKFGSTVSTYFPY